MDIPRTYIIQPTYIHEVCVYLRVDIRCLFEHMEDGYDPHCCMYKYSGNPSNRATRPGDMYGTGSTHSPTPYPPAMNGRFEPCSHVRVHTSNIHAHAIQPTAGKLARICVRGTREVGERWERWERFLGREPVRLLKEKSTVCRLSRLAKEEGIGPVRLFFDSILFEQFRHKEIWNVLGFLQTFN